MLNLRKPSSLIISLWIILFATCASIKAAKTVITQPENLFVPETRFYDSNNQPIYLDQYEGKTLLLVFWATWCGSCVNEMLSLDSLQKDFRHLSFEVLAISEDHQGVKAVTDFYKLQQIRHLAIYHDYQNQLFKALAVAGLPTAFLVNPNGQVKVIFKGIIKWHDEAMRAMILAEIPGNPASPKNSYKSNSLNNIVPRETSEPTTIESKNN